MVLKIYLSIINVVGLYLYPLYQSAAAIGNKDQAGLKRWLLFWAFLGAFFLLESVLPLLSK